MTVAMWILLAAVVVLIAAALFVWKNKHSQQLRRRFGPEYDRLVRETGSAARAEKELDHRRKRVERFALRFLSREESEQFAARWRTAQERFVDDPRSAVADADQLVQSVLKARGYPVGNFDERAADISVEHARVVEHYRVAHEIAENDAQSKATTEDLRAAMNHYKALFEDLLDRRVNELQEVRR